MTILQFIVDMKWVFLVLILAGVIAVWIRRSSDATRTAFRNAIISRGLKVGLPGGIAVDWAPPSPGAVAAAAAPDEALAQNATGAGQAQATPEQVQALRRDAVEQVMREAAQWGWTMARSGYRNPPVPYIYWVDGQPAIALAATTSVTTGPAAQQANLIADWARMGHGQQPGI